MSEEIIPFKKARDKPIDKYTKKEVDDKLQDLEKKVAAGIEKELKEFVADVGKNVTDQYNNLNSKIDEVSLALTKKYVPKHELSYEMNDIKEKISDHNKKIDALGAGYVEMDGILQKRSKKKGLTEWLRSH